MRKHILTAAAILLVSIMSIGFAGCVIPFPFNKAGSGSSSIFQTAKPYGTVQSATKMPVHTTEPTSAPTQSAAATATANPTSTAQPATTAKPTATASSSSSSKVDYSLYKAVLDDHKKEYHLTITYYLYDLNEDGISELIVDFMPSEGGRMLYIYSIVNGKLEELYSDSCGGMTISFSKDGYVYLYFLRKELAYLDRISIDTSTLSYDKDTIFEMKPFDETDSNGVQYYEKIEDYLAKHKPANVPAHDAEDYSPINKLK